MEIGFIGLGAMGAPMAANLARAGLTKVWNRTAEVALSHQQEHGSLAVADLEDLGDVEVVCSCLPTDVEVAAAATSLGPVLAAGTVWIDHTSGDPRGTRDVAAMLEGHGVHYLDAPVSGGTDGAAAGTLTTMVGGEADVLDRVRPVLDVVAKTIVHVGPVGSGMAVKAVNNALVATNLWAVAEGLAALTKAGVPASTALEVINTSSGRSFASEKLVPEHALTRAFPVTFALSLLAKDVGLAQAVLADAEVDARVLPLIDELTRAASEELGPDAGHVEIVRILERAAGVELR
jgi:3-hydroxyisobutyrate dehydrogenase